MSTEPRFVADFMLGRLAKWLRIFGYDTVYTNNKDHAPAIALANAEQRIFLTRDTNAAAKKPWKMVLVKDDLYTDQLAQLVREIGITLDTLRMSMRCSVCNGVIVPVNKTKVEHVVPPFVYTQHSEFSCCQECGKVYWPGTHQALLLQDLRKAGLTIT